MAVSVKQTRTQKVAEASAKIDQHIKALAEEMAAGKSEQLLRYLGFCAQFHQYSFGNLLLALSQCPTLTFLAGIRKWNELGRTIKKGEKGIMILAPIRVKRRVERKDTQRESINENGEEQSDTILLFKPVYVFDVSQTEGAELPDIISANGEVDTWYPALEQAVQTAGVRIEYVDQIAAYPGAEGISLGGCIQVVHQETPAEQFRVLVHEFAHELLHKDECQENRTVKETEADAVAYVVCRHFGVTSDTADYLLLHDSNPKLLLERLETVRQMANRIITTMTESDNPEEK